jgi:uncharacterized protein with NAD-binding domain and iron-sulfur cluster
MTREKIAILGGGVGGMTAAFALTEGENRDRYDVTVYQLGWRLGGKGASGRNLGPGRGQRIEEHGLHIWFGFYYNAFPLMRRCYEELEGDAEAWKKAFAPHSYVVLEEHLAGGWRHLPMPFPPRPGTLLTRREYVRELLRWIGEAIARAPAPVVAEESWFDRASALVRDLVHGHPGLDLLHDAIAEAERLAADPTAALAEADGALHHLVDDFHGWLGRHVADLVDAHDDVRRLWLAVDLAATVVRGMLADGVLVHADGFDRLDDRDFRQWLTDHGASPATVDSAWVRAFYSLAFAFVEGAVDRRSMAAGTVLRGALRMLFAYDGSVMWKMQGGMGDVIFAPLYRVLQKRGVKFRFFHRVRALHLSRDFRTIERITLGQQLRVKTGEYAPLVAVESRPCWPSAPDWTQLDDGQVAHVRTLEDDPNAYVNLESVWSSWGPAEEDTVVLERGAAGDRGFDRVLLAIPPPGLRSICAELIEVDADWRRMVDEVQTVRTQAFQLWLDVPLERLWTLPSPVSGAFVEPIDTWADMSHLLPLESWPEGSVRFLAYFCGVMSESGAEPPWFRDPSFPKAKKADAFAAMREHLERHMQYMWPGFDWSVLHDPSGGAGADRLAAQYWVANVEPSERYVLSLPGTTALRLPKGPRGSGFENLYLAGDWTRNGINAGCVEAAVMSGLQASRAISGHPATIIGETDL